ncbi:MAG: 23S rRNA (adenine(2503)-C(2))-methyltransferase RlmN [Chloroflexota bacterium]
MLATTKKRILDLSYSELRELMVAWGEPSYRANQVLGWVYQKGAVAVDEMTDLPLSLRERLTLETQLPILKPIETRVSSDGLTRKTLFELSDGSTIESTLMRYNPGESARERGTVCVSTQVGCPIGCPFCATGGQGFTRNLSQGEIVGQVLHCLRQSGVGEKGTKRPLTNIVFMGMGEPLANYEAVVGAINLLNASYGLNLNARHITLSTVGLIPQIYRLIEDGVRVELAISLHAPDNELRNRLVPVNRKYPVEELIRAAKEFLKKTGRRPSFEYALFKGVNDSPRCARELARLLKGLNTQVNLIAGNSTGKEEFKAPERQRTLDFLKELRSHGVSATLREPRGLDIDGGCGQLRSRYLISQERK